MDTWLTMIRTYGLNILVRQIYPSQLFLSSLHCYHGQLHLASLKRDFGASTKSKIQLH